MQSTLNEPDADAWPQIAPLLDDALGKLGERDRNALVLRFFENKSLAEVGTALGASEDAAKMRVNRALEKLRKLFGKRGVALSATLIAGAVSAGSVQAAPAGLAATISTVAITKGAAAGGSTLALVKGALKIMAWTKMKTAIVVVAAILAVGATPVVISLIPGIKGKELTTDLAAQYARMTGLTPEAAAKTFFDACGREDWAEVAKFWGSLDDKFKNNCGGLQLMSLGTPYRGRYFDVKFRVFVPYEIRLKNGRPQKGVLAIRCDVTPDNRWHIDGGF